MNLFKFLSYYFLLFISCSDTLNAQSRFRHVIEYKFEFGSSDDIYYRQFLSDSIFVECNFQHLTRMLSDTQFVSRDTFKVVNGTWRYCLNGKYYPFFSDSMFKKGEMTKVYYNQIRNTDSFYSCSGYLPYKIEKINNKDVYVFKVSFGSCVTGVFNNIDIAYFYFDPSFGFIKKQFWNFAVRDVTILKER